MEELVVFGIPAAAIIIALIELAKSYGMNARWAPLVAIVLGIGLSVGVYYSGINPQVATWFKLLLGGVLVGLSAVGGFSGGRSVVNSLRREK